MPNCINLKKLLQKGRLDNLSISDFIVCMDYHKIGRYRDVDVSVDVFLFLRNMVLITKVFILKCRTECKNILLLVKDKRKIICFIIQSF